MPRRPPPLQEPRPECASCDSQLQFIRKSPYRGQELRGCLQRPPRRPEVQRASRELALSHDASAAKTALRFLAMTARYARVVASGLLRPCSHSWSVRGLMQNAHANSACDIPAWDRMRLTSTSSGSTTRRVGSLLSPFTWASISLALSSSVRPSLVLFFVPVSELRMLMIVVLPLLLSLS